VIFSYYNGSISIYRKNGDSWSTSYLHDVNSDEFGRSLSLCVEGDSVWIAFYAEFTEEETINKYLLCGKYNPFSNMWNTNIDNGQQYIRISTINTEYISKTDILLSEFNEPLLLYILKQDANDSTGDLKSVNLDNRLLTIDTITYNIRNFIQAFDNNGDYFVFYTDNANNLYKKDINGISTIDNTLQTEYIYAQKDLYGNFLLYFGEYSEKYFIYDINSQEIIVEVNHENNVNIERSSNVINSKDIFCTIVYNSGMLRLLQIPK
jgi:hypothetical protein